ncbi:MAG: 50S ribosomal protein L6 [Planctomycetes bacterium]|nr:50S ribosomal protein L6 [Planctomycetota bacterium]
MSRIGRLPVAIPSGVTVEEKDRRVTVKGPKGALALQLRPEIDIKVEKAQLLVQPNAEDARQVRAYHGMTRAILNNMMKGVTQGYLRNLEIIGVGWNAALAGKKLMLSVGFCNPVEMPIPEGLTVEVPKPTNISVKGADKQLVGQFAAAVRAQRPPEPYKGKGIRYEGEYVRKKQGKSFGS